MEPADHGAFEKFLEAYGSQKRPMQYGNPNHCDECAEANKLLLDRFPEELEKDELVEPSKGWFFSWIGPDGWRYFLPGFVRLALESPRGNLHILLSHVHQEWIRILNSRERRALLDVLEYCQACGYAQDNRERDQLDQFLYLLETEPFDASNASPR